MHLYSVPNKVYSSNSKPSLDDVYHHGILGMKWGKKNGPPYPLSGPAHSSSENKAGYQKSIGSSGHNEEDYAYPVKKKKASHKEKNISGDFSKLQGSYKKYSERSERYKQHRDDSSADAKAILRSKDSDAKFEKDLEDFANKYGYEKLSVLESLQGNSNKHNKKLLKEVDKSVKKEKIQELKKYANDKNIPAEYRKWYKNQIKNVKKLDHEKLSEMTNIEKGIHKKESDSKKSYNKAVNDLNKKYKVKSGNEYYVRNKNSTWSNYKDMAKDFEISESEAKKMWDYSEEVDKLRKKYG